MKIDRKASLQKLNNSTLATSSLDMNNLSQKD